MVQVVQPAGLEAAAPQPVRARTHSIANVTLWRLFLFVVFLALFGPLLILMLFSVNDSNILAFPLEGITFHWYGDAFADRLLREALFNSVLVAAIVAPICLVLGTLTAFGLTNIASE